MGTRNPQFDAYIAKSAPFARPVLEHIRRVVHAGCPDVVEEMKWSAPHFTYKGMLCSMASFKAHCAFGFWNASSMEGAVRSRDAMGHFGRIASIADLPPEKTLIRLVRQAAKLNEAGVRRPRAAKTPRPDAAVPPELTAALRLKKHAKAAAAFAALSPSHRREYIEWIGEAKRDETRARRLATTLEWLTEGKSRNWKYTEKGRTDA